MKKLSFLVLLLLPLLVLYGCGNSGSTSTSATSAKTGSLSVAAKFPSAGKQGEVGAALIDANTTCIQVDIYPWSGPSHQVFLTPASPSNTITDIGVGVAEISIYTSDGAPFDFGFYTSCDGNELDHLYVAAAIEEGSNTMTATLIRGSWTLATPILLNSTLPSSTETITGFTIDPSMYVGPVGMKASIDEAKASSRNDYPIFWKGSLIGMYNGADFNDCYNTDTFCMGMDSGPHGTEYMTVKYYSQFVGPSTSNNAIDDGEIQLIPNDAYPDMTDWVSYPARSNRDAFFFGIPLGFDSTNVWGEGYGSEGGDGPMVLNTPTDSDAMPEINAYATTKVTGSNTMSGYIIEELGKSFTNTSQTCVLTSGGWNNPANQAINCPAMGGPTKVSTKSLSKAILKATSGAVGKSATVGANGCFTEDVTATGTDNYSGYGDVWNSDPSAYYTPDCGEVNGIEVWDGSIFTCDNTCCGDGYYEDFDVITDYTWVGQLCGHPFTATGTTIPQTELDLIIR